MKQEGSVPFAALSMQVLVPTLNGEDGSSTAKLSPSSGVTQVVTANPNSTIAGAFASFPPGSLAVETDVTLAPGTSLSSALGETDFASEISILSEAPAVTVAGSVSLNTDAAFTVNIPIPQSAGLHQLGLNDLWANLAVFYRIERQGETIIGAYSRDQLTILNGFVSLVTREYGTFQAIFLSAPLKAAREVAASKPAEPDVTPGPEKPAALSRKIFARGFLTSTPASPSSDPEATFVVHSFSPAVVGGMNGLSLLQTGFLSRAQGQDRE